MPVSERSVLSNASSRSASDGGVSAELIMEEDIEDANAVLQGTVIHDAAIPTLVTNAVPESSEASTLSFVSGPTFTAGPVSPVPLHSSPATYIPVQVPGVIETTFTQSPAFAAPLVYPPALAGAYIAGAAASPPATPCTFMSAAAPITAVCHCIYAQPCALHHRPITYTPHSFSSLGMVSATLSPSHSHSLPAVSNPVALPVQVPSVRPSLILPPLRSSAMRLKRSGEQLTAASVQTTNAEDAANIHLQKVRRVEQPSAEASSSDLAPQRHANVRASERSTTDGSRPLSNSVFCCECRGCTTCISCPCHQHHHHMCPRHPVCFCQQNAPATSYRRDVRINRMHHMLLSSHIAQMERQRQANSLWFQRHALVSDNLVGVDVVTRHVQSHPLVILPRQQQPIMELAMVLLQPHDPTGALGGNIPPSSDPLPIGATVEQINRFSTMYKYVKEINIPENEQERCTVCLDDFEMNEEVRALHCAHVFHVVCIDRWLVYNKKCPVCRLDLDKSSEETAVNSL